MRLLQSAMGAARRSCGLLLRGRLRDRATATHAYFPDPTGEGLVGYLTATQCATTLLEGDA